MSITKLFTRALLFVLCFTLSLNFTPILEAGKIPNFKIDPKLEARLRLESENLQNALPPKSKVKPIIKKDTSGKMKVDFESNVKMTKNQEIEYEKCKTEEMVRRSKRNQNKPTACRKETRNPKVELIEQDYTILIDRIQEKNDLDKGLDMSLELPLETFIDTKDLVECSDILVTSSSISPQKSSITSDNTCNSNSSSTSSSSGISDSSTALSSNSSSVLSSTVTSSSQNNSSLAPSSNSSLASSSKTSLLDFFFPKIGVHAVGIAGGTKVDGYRLPYPTGTKIGTYRGMNESLAYPNDTHNSKNAIDLASFKNNFEYYDSDIVAAKSGQVVVYVDTTFGFGKHIVIKQDDGHYAIYGHLSSRTKGVNEVVNRSDKIAIQGNTGNSSASHLHFEVLNSSVANQSNCSNTNVFSSCYNQYSILDTYKIIPQFDECFANRGGADENECKVGNTNEGYPTISQSWSSGRYYTSMNGATQPYNNYGAQVWPQDNNNFRWDVFGANTADQSRVKLWGYNGGVA